MRDATADLAQDLRAALSGDVRFDLYSRTLYSTDASSYQIMPVGVVLPRAGDEIAAIVEICGRYGVPVLPRGAGSSLAGQAVGAALHIDFSQNLFQVLEVNVEERWVRCLPGVNADALNHHLRPYGLMFGPDPASSNRATVGGMVANNSTGAHSILYGMTGDHVRAARVVLSDGQVATWSAQTPAGVAAHLHAAGLEGAIYRTVTELLATHGAALRAHYPRTWRRASGYSLNYLLPAAERTATFPPAWGGPQSDSGFNLARLLASSEGTLAVATEFTLDLVPRPALTALDVVHFDDLLAAATATTTILEEAPSAVELIDDTMIELARGVPAYARWVNWVEGRPRAVLVVEFYGNSEAELTSKLDALEARLRRAGVAHTFVRALTPTQQAQVWGVRKVGLGLLMSVRGDHKPLAFMEDVAVPVAHLAEYLAATQRIFAHYGLQSAVYAHASAGCLHIRPLINLKSVAGVATMRAVAEAILAEVIRLGGAMSGEHGDGLSRSEWNARLFGPEVYGAFRALKQACDPRGLLNPGKVVDAPPMDTHLRYGAGYQAAHPVTLFDFTLEGGLAGAVEQCNGAAVCRQNGPGTGTMCPSYRATREEEHSPRGRANLLRAALSGRLPEEELWSERMHDALDLCLECKACKAECPSAVDIAKVKYEWLAQYHARHGTPWRARAFAQIHRLSRWGAPLGVLINALAATPPARALLARMGLDETRALPQFAPVPFDVWFRGRPAPDAAGRPRIALFHDTFTTYYAPEAGQAAVRVLERAGYAVELIAERGCCGRPMISKGDLRGARAALAHNVARFAPYAEQGVPLVGLEPSCLLTLRDEGPALLPGDARAQAVAGHVLLLEEFLAREHAAGRWVPPVRSGRVLVHGHCHAKALVGTAPLLSVLRAAGYAADEIDAGCCGMAGSFGYEREHAEIAQAIGAERLFPAVQAAAAGTVVVATGFSCRQQIAHGTGRRARHIAELLV